MSYIMLAEDDHFLAGIFQKWLETGGHEVQRVENGAEGLTALVDSRIPDLLITDIMMPRADGEALTLVFGSLAAGQPVLVVTACDDKKILDGVTSEPQVKEVLQKPISCKQLLGAVEKIIG